MSCPKNIINRQFLFFKWKSEGEHDFEIDYISTFMLGNTDFILNKTCKICGTPKKESFVSWEQMLRMGYTNSQLRDIQWSYFGKTPDEIKLIK